MAEIARAADVSTQTVFNYFPTKEDLVYWRLESFEDELLGTIREREPGESALAAFGRFVRAPRGMLGDYDAEARERAGGAHAHDRLEPGAAGARAADLRGLHATRSRRSSAATSRPGSRPTR